MQQIIAPEITEIKNQQQWVDTIKGNRNIIVVFQADWCGPCKKAIEALQQQQTLQKTKQEDQGKYLEINIAKVNTDTYQPIDLMKEYAKEGIPSIVVFKMGKQTQKIVGYNPKSIQDLFESALN